MSNSIEELMRKDPLELSAQDLDGIIAYQRKARQSYESGGKVKKSDSSPKIDLIQLGILKGKQSTIAKRKI